jgi:multidrug efflux pump subunit AcrB
MNFSSWSIRNPVPVIMLFVLLALIGLMAFSSLKVQDFPDVDLPTVTITTTLKGAAAAQLEVEVARKLESAVIGLQGVKHVYSKVQDGLFRRRWRTYATPLTECVPRCRRTSTTR